MANVQTAAEKELIAKWNAGDYSAEGWVDNTEGLTEAARKGLARYNTEKYLGGVDLNKFQLGALAAGTPVLLEDSKDGAFIKNGDAKLSIMSCEVIGVSIVYAVVKADFGMGFKAFRVIFPSQGSAGNKGASGKASWEPKIVSFEQGPVVMQILPKKKQIILQASLSAEFRLEFTGPAPANFNTVFQGGGFFTPE